MGDRLDWIFEEPRELEGRYDAWAATYDADHDRWGWVGPQRVAAAAVGHHPDRGVALDAGCGTGKAGIALRAAGWTGTLIGVDFSQGMLDVAATSNAYDQLIKGSLYELELEDDSVDAVVSSGVFTHGHVGGEAYAELCRITRSGGTVTTTQRLDIGPDLLEADEALRSGGVWVEIERTTPELFHPERDTVEQTVVTWRIL